MKTVAFTALALSLAPLLSMPAALAREGDAPPSSFRSSLEDDAGAGTYRHFVRVHPGDGSGDRVLLFSLFASLFTLLGLAPIIDALDRRASRRVERELLAERRTRDEETPPSKRAA